MLNKRKNTRDSQKLNQIFKLLPLFSFFLASVVFIFAIPTSATDDSQTPSMSMKGGGHGLHSNNYKIDSQFTPLFGLATAASIAVLFFFYTNFYAIAQLFPQSLPYSTGIRAPPFQI